MKAVSILYSCEVWHGQTIKTLIGVFSNPNALNLYLRKMKRSGMITQSEYDELVSIGQTRWRRDNYIINVVPMNPKYIPEDIKNV